MSRLVLLRHGESEWNKLNLFTGWYDCELTEAGMEEAFAARRHARRGRASTPTSLHTSLQVRAIRTANIALDVLGRLWIPVRRSWRLNERHYGDLTGKNKAETTAEYGEDMVKVWRRSYDTPPPAITDDNEFNPNDDVRYESLPPELVPAQRVPQGRRRAHAPLLVRRDRAGPRRRRHRAGRRPRQLPARRW